MSNFGSGIPSGPLTFTAGQPVNVSGKFFNSGNLTVSGCNNVSIQGCDFADGFGLSLDGCTGTITMSHNRFRNPGVNAIKVTNSILSGQGIVHNSFRGRTASTVDYMLFQNSGGPSTTSRLRIQYNHADSSDPVTGLVNFPANGGSAIRYGGITTAGRGFASLVYNTCLNSGPYGIVIDSGQGIILYYCIFFGQKNLNSIAPICFKRGVGTVGGDVTVTLNNIHWMNAAGSEVLFVDDGSLAVTYSENVPLAVDLNAIVLS